MLNQTPSAFRQLMIAQTDSDRQHQLRCVIFGGEALEPPALVPWYVRNGERTQLVNMYGITETTVHVTYAPLSPEDTQRSSRPIGVPIPDLRVVLLDPHRQPVPVGVAGEMYVGGAGVSRGYLNRPDLTAERFLPDPFAGQPGARMCQTGDLGRRRADGTIEFLGRNDQQVKIRGFRIELGEIEAALLQHPAVREAVVLARDDAPGHPRLVAYVVGRDVLPQALRSHLAERLPEYMVPAAYVQLDTLPLTSNGKLDRRALPAPHDNDVPRRSHEPPHIGIEQALAQVWSSLLGVPRIARDDHFFELGGHSMLVVRLVASAKQRGMNLTLQDVYAHPTLQAQAKQVIGTSHDSPGVRALAARRTGSATPLFVLPAGMGDITYAFELAVHVDADNPVYALPWPRVMPESMRALAAHMVELMRAVQREGPYRLLGYSAGGLLAYAVAQLLGELDEPVEFLGLLDSENPATQPLPDTREEIAKRLLISALTDDPELGKQDDIQETIRQLEEAAKSATWDELLAIFESSPALLALATQMQTSISEFAQSCMQTAEFRLLWRAYLSQPLPASLRLSLFRAEAEGWDTQHLGWEPLVPVQQIDVTHVPGTHMSMMDRPHIAELGRAVSQSLPQASAEDAG